MSREHLLTFRDQVWDDEERLQALRSAEDRTSFNALLIDLGSRAGFDFNEHDIEQLVRENQLVWLQRWT